ncbi:protein kinase [Pendulispora rubella]|uniref:Protein kinase n=1 Tax=Pendulispora rubella TaxID=2741070 RepID=A0ABZ2KW09_9BACT
MIGPYRITAVLGRGGMGVVYRGEHDETGHVVAVKTVRVSSDTLVESIRREIHALSRIRHPGIASIVGEGVSDGLPYYAMELLTGETLRSYLARLWAGSARARSTVDTASHSGTVTANLAADAVPDSQAALRKAVFAPARVSLPAIAPFFSLVRGLCASLAYLHGEGLVHRDLKPENVFVDTDGRPVLVDLGIAALSGAAGREELRTERAVLGSVGYMAPEQIRGEIVDARADLYALGCLLYEGLTGQTPFQGATAAAILYQHLSERPVPPSARVDGVEPALDQLVVKLLAKRPEDRFGHAEDVAAALAALGVPPCELGGPPAKAYLYRPALVGRDAVLAELDAAIDRVVDARVGGICLLAGESGVGKTRLAIEVAYRAARRGVHVVTGQCAAVAAPLHPFRPLLRAIATQCRLQGHAGSEAVLGPGCGAIAAYEPSLAALPWVRAQPEPPPRTPEAARRHLVESLARVVRRFARARPVLLVFDDLQWADELSFAVLRQLADDGAGACFVLGAYRSEELTPDLAVIARAPGVRDVALGRLDDAGVAAVASGMLALPEPPRDLVDFLAAQSDGNPFFVAEYLRAALDEGLLTRDGVGQWHLHERAGGARVLAASVPLPHTLADLIEQRLAALDVPARALVEWASVFGREFDARLLVAAAGLADDTLLETLEALRLRRVLDEPVPGRLRFVHDKIGERAYESIPETRRCALHRGAAHVIEDFYGDVPDYLPELGHHFAHARVHDKGAHYLARAADRSRAAYAQEDAIRYYRAAIHEIALAGAEMAPSRHGLEDALGDTLALVGRQDEARAAYEAALDAMPADARVPRAAVHRKIGKAWETHHQHAHALSAYAEAEAALGAPPPDEAASAWWQEWVQIQNDRVYVHYWLAQIDEMNDVIARLRPVVEKRGTALQLAHFFDDLLHRNLRRERYRASAETVEYACSAKAAAQKSNDVAKASYSWFMMGFALLFRGAFVDAEAELLGALAESERIGDRTLQARCLTYLTMTYRRQRRVAETHARATRCLQLSVETAMTDYQGVAKANLAWVRWCAGDIDGAAREVAASLALWRTLASQYPYPMQWMGLWVAIALALAAGALDEAVPHVRAMLDPKQESAPPELCAELEAAVAHWERGAAHEAAQRLARAAEMAKDAGYL